jgi:hypothetical protein
LPHESRIAELVRSYAVGAEGNLFAELSVSVRFEDVGKGRQGAVLVKCDEAGDVPLVRTTTRYCNPAQSFRPVHERLAQRIQQIALLPVGFNNALIEIYTSEYATMGSHSDQALDLADGSFIALFSCYEHPERVRTPRKLLVESKESGGESVGIPLTDNGVIVFSVDANRRLRHKIVLDAPARMPENRWLGITFRTSQTFVRYRDGGVYLPDDTPLTSAGDEQRREFYHLRRRENDGMDFTYPQIGYTISDSDLMPPALVEEEI